MKDTFILFGILIFLIYIFINPKATKETFKVNSTEGIDIIQNIFKKNFDLDYYDTRDPKKISELKKMFTNKLAPLIQQEITNNPSRVKAVMKQLNSRLPGKSSNVDEYVIPMPKFNNLQGDLLKPLVKSFKQIKNLTAKRGVDYKPIRNMDNIQPIKKIKKKKDHKELFNNSKITERTISNNLNCKFITSFKSTNKCPADFPIYTGATVSGKGSNLSCNGKNVNGKRAIAIAIIKKGEIIDIKILNKGDLYSKIPKIYIRGIGKGGMAKTVIKNGKVINIELINGGSGYISTPTVIIEQPHVNIHCNLCCKK
jgi:hypothetical protein